MVEGEQWKRNTGEGVEKRNYTVVDNVNGWSYYERTVWKFLEKLKIELPYDPAIPLLGIYMDKTIIQKDNTP